MLAKERGYTSQVEGSISLSKLLRKSIFKMDKPKRDLLNHEKRKQQIWSDDDRSDPIFVEEKNLQPTREELEDGEIILEEGVCEGEGDGDEVGSEDSFTDDEDDVLNKDENVPSDDDDDFIPRDEFESAQSSEGDGVDEEEEEEEDEEDESEPEIKNCRKNSKQHSSDANANADAEDDDDDDDLRDFIASDEEESDY